MFMEYKMPWSKTSVCEIWWQVNNRNMKIHVYHVPGNDIKHMEYIFIYIVYMWQMPSVFSHESAQRNDAGHLKDENVFKTTIHRLKVYFTVFCSICRTSGDTKPLVAKWPICFKDIFTFFLLLSNLTQTPDRCVAMQYSKAALIIRYHLMGIEKYINTPNWCNGYQSIHTYSPLKCICTPLTNPNQSLQVVTVPFTVSISGRHHVFQ